MDAKLIVIVTTVVAFLFTHACAEASTSYYMDVKPGVSDYVTVVCSPAGNPLGFSIELPRCYCHGGIMLVYVVKTAVNGKYITSFELHRGYLIDYGVETIAVSRDGRTIDHMTVGGKAITQRSDPTIWQGASESFADLMTDYGPRFYEVEALCRAKQGSNAPLTMSLRVAPSSVSW
jgi:hypothetical protein